MKKTILQYNAKNKRGGGYHCSNYFGEVPNTPAGLKFIKKLRSLIGPIWVTGRNPNRKQFAVRGNHINKSIHRQLRSNLPPRLGTTIVIYRRLPYYWKRNS